MLMLQPNVQLLDQDRFSTLQIEAHDRLVAATVSPYKILKCCSSSFSADDSTTAGVGAISDEVNEVSTAVTGT